MVKRIAALMLGLILLPLCACAEAYPDLPELEGVSLALDNELPITKKTDDLHIRMTNGSEFEVTFGEEFRLEIHRNGAWRSVGRMGPVIAIGYGVFPGETYAHTFRVSALTRSPKAGSYRIGVPFLAQVIPAPTPPLSFAEQLEAAKADRIASGQARPYTEHIAYAYFEMVP